MPTINTRYVPIWILLLFLLMGCQVDPVKKQISPGAASPPTTNTIFQDTVQVVYAKNFKVSYRQFYKVVRVSSTLRDWEQVGATQDIEEVMVLVPEGQSPPPLRGELAGATVIPISNQARIATNASGLEIWLEMLGLKEQLVAIGGSKTFDDDLRAQLEEGQIGTVGYSWAAPPNLEVLLKSHSSLFLAVFSRIDSGTSLGKLRKLGIPTAPVFDWAEKSYLGRAEWIKYCALFFNAEAEANAIFSRIEGEVQRLKNLVREVEHKPTCLWGHYVDSGFFLAHANNAEARLLSDAGAINPVQNFDLPFNPIGRAFTSEEMLIHGKDAEFWIIGSGVDRTPLPGRNYLEGFQAWRDGRLYHHYLRSKPAHNAYDWFNLAPIRPDYVLADLIALLHPQLLPHHQAVFFGAYPKLAGN